MKSYDVDMVSFVNVLIPGDCDPATKEGYEVLYEAARKVFIDRLVTRQSEFKYQRYPDGDTEEEGRAE
jgi:hypothetical protein